VAGWRGGHLPHGCTRSPPSPPSPERRVQLRGVRRPAELRVPPGPARPLPWVRWVGRSLL